MIRNTFSLIIFLAVGIFTYNHAFSQIRQNVFAFFEYDIKNGMNDQFMNGYERDLEWHESQEDNWSWIGWFVINGNRRGRFIDATPYHSWSDFDNWKVNASENARLNKIHWLPYVENLSGSYRIILEQESEYKQDWMKKKYLQVYQIDVKVGRGDDFKTFISNYKETLKAMLGELSFIWMKTISGGGVNEYHLLVGLDKIEELEHCEKLFNFPKSQADLLEDFGNSVNAITTELWIFSDRLSLISN